MSASSDLLRCPLIPGRELFGRHADIKDTGRALAQFQAAGLATKVPGKTGVGLKIAGSADSGFGRRHPPAGSRGNGLWSLPSQRIGIFISTDISGMGSRDQTDKSDKACDQQVGCSSQK